MEPVEDIVIVGAGIAGLAIALGLHRNGIRSLVLESADKLRSHGYALALWTNAWKALDAIGIGDILRQKHSQLDSLVTMSTISGLATAELSLKSDCEVRHINRKVLLETLKGELPEGTIRYSAKLVCIQDSGYFKLLHLADGTILKSKVLIGCDGVNSVVARFLHFRRPSSVGRASIRGHVEFEDGHGFEPKFLHFSGNGVRYGIAPCGTCGVYWFFTYIPSSLDTGIEEGPAKMKQFVCSKLGNVPDKIRAVFVKTNLNNMIWSQLKYRHPWDLLWGNISKGNVCVAGDALHPMTPDIGQGGCSALEDSVTLVRILAEALTRKPSTGIQENGEELERSTGIQENGEELERSTGIQENGEELEHRMIEIRLKKYGGERRWRSMKLVCAAYVVGYIQQSDGILISFLRDKVLAKLLAGILLKMSDFDCGKLMDS